MDYICATLRRVMNGNHEETGNPQTIEVIYPTCYDKGYFNEGSVISGEKFAAIVDIIAQNTEGTPAKTYSPESTVISGNREYVISSIEIKSEKETFNM